MLWQQQLVWEINNMKTENRAAGGGITIISLLQVVFITLKLCRVINWSWPVVLIPLWIQLGVWIIIGVIWMIIAYKARH